MRKTVCLGSLVLFGLLAPTVSASWFDSVNVTPSVRWRYQDVSDPVFNDASAHTGLIRLSVSAELSDSIEMFAQGDHSFSLGRLDYSDGVTLRDASFIPDPEVTEFNQLWISYQTDFGGMIEVGRRILERANERHIGGNGFWQNEQSFDSVGISYNPIENLSVSYVYLDRVNRIFGPDANARLSDDDIRFNQLAFRPALERGVHNHSSHLFDVDYQLNNTTSLSAFIYSLDNKTFHGFSSHTIGVRLEGSAKPKKIKYLYEVELATQTDAYDSPWSYRAHYIATNVGMQFKSHRFELNYENIGDDNGFGFVHSLGSNHQFQGWADVFDQYQKPEGMSDTSIVYRGRKNTFRWRAKFHVFQSADHSVNAGRELDLELAWRATRKLELSVIVARYIANDGFNTLPASQENRTTWFLSVKYNL